MPTTDRAYQARCYSTLRTLYDEGQNDLLVVAATGAGKTVMFSRMVTEVPELSKHGTLVLVHREELAEQTAQKMAMVNPGLNIEIEMGERFASPMASVVVGSVQTLGHKNPRRLQRLLARQGFGYVVVDEAHHMKPRSQYDTVLTPLGLGAIRTEGGDLLPDGQRRLLTGWTATPNRSDRVGLSHFFSAIAETFDLRFCIEEGYLCEPVQWVCATSSDLSGVRTQQGDYQVGQLAAKVNVKERNELIVKSYMEKCRRADGELMSAMAFCADVEHAHALAECFRSFGIPAASADYKTDRAERQQMLRDHESGAIKVLCNNMLWTEGYDGRVEAVLMARPTKSKSLYTQMLGRGLRTIPSNIGNYETKQERLDAIASSMKPVALVLDFVDTGVTPVTAPSLFGAPPKLGGKGQRVLKELVDVVESAIKDNPESASAIRDIESLDEIELVTKRVDIMALARASHGLKGARLRWMPVGEDTWQLDVPRSKDGKQPPFSLRIERDLIGACTVTHITPRRMNNGTVTPEERRAGKARYPTPEAAAIASENRLESAYPGRTQTAQKHAMWRMNKPSDKQMAMLRKLGVDPALATSKGVATDLIDAAIAHKRNRALRA